MADVPDEIADDLYGAPFDEFIARRDMAAKELRREKRREEADAVKKLKKPALSAWAVNQLRRADPDRVDGLLAAGAALRQAKTGEALRDATHDERAAVDELVDSATALLREAGHTVTDKTSQELRDTLHAIALDDATREQVAAGRLLAPARAVGLGAFVPTAGKAEGKTRTAASKSDAQRAEAERKAREAAEAAAKRERVKAARNALRDAERELARAQKAVDAARAEVEKAEAS